jgi:hypothetical protein
MQALLDLCCVAMETQKLHPQLLPNTATECMPRYKIIGIPIIGSSIKNSCITGGRMVCVTSVEVWFMGRGYE